MLSERAERQLPYAVDALFDLAADFEQYPDYLPGWRSARIDRRAGEWLEAEQCVGFGPLEVRFRTAAKLRRPQFIEVTSDDPQFERFRLLWTFSAARAPLCRVVLSVDLELHGHLLQHVIEDIAPGSAQAVLEAFAERARAMLPAQRVT